MSAAKNPKFMKDAAGFCYVYTDTLAKQKHLTPYDGEIDANGMAVDAKPARQVKPKGKADVEAPAETPADNLAPVETPDTSAE